MENEIRTQTPVDSVIAAYGVSSARRLSPFVLLIGGVISVILALIVLIWSLTGRISLPSETAFLGIATPKSIYTHLSESERDRLPTVWKAQVDTRSHWPTLFGASREGHEWHFFVIAPRWSLAKTDLGTHTVHVRAIGVLPAPELVPPAQITSYWSWLVRTWRHPSAHAQFEVYPETLAQTATPSPEPLVGILYTDHIATNLRAPAHIPASPTTTSDIYLRFDPQVTTSVREVFLGQLHLGHEDANALGFTPTSFSAQYNTSGTVGLLRFETIPMSSSTKVRILGAFGFSQKTVRSLPDGSALIERRLPNEAELQTTTTYHTNFGELTLTDTLLQLLREETSPTPTFTSCNRGPLIGRFSAQALSELFKTVDLSFISVPNGIQFHEDHGNVTICRE